MQCYVCALEGTPSGAVGLCDVCAVGLCIDHLEENALREGPGGMRAYGCLHNPGRDRRSGGGERRRREADEELEPALAPIIAGARRAAQRASSALERARAPLHPQPAFETAMPG